MIKYFVKKYIISQINSAMDKYSKDISSLSILLSLWISRLDKILGFLKALTERIQDASLSDKEIDDTVADIEKVIAEWK